MSNVVDTSLEELRRRDVPDRKNGYYFRIRSYPAF
jgi:hypothetical protein